MGPRRRLAALPGRRPVVVGDGESVHGQREEPRVHLLELLEAGVVPGGREGFIESW